MTFSQIERRIILAAAALSILALLFPFREARYIGAEKQKSAELGPTLIFMQPSNLTAKRALLGEQTGDKYDPAVEVSTDYARTFFAVVAVAFIAAGVLLACRLAPLRRL